MIELLIRVLAAWRITRLVVDDEIAAPLRDKVRDVTGPDSKWTYLVNCPYCVSVWAGLAVAVKPKWMASSLAASAGTLGIKWASSTTELALGSLMRGNRDGLRQ